MRIQGESMGISKSPNGLLLARGYSLLLVAKVSKAKHISALSRSSSSSQESNTHRAPHDIGPRQPRVTRSSYDPPLTVDQTTANLQRVGALEMGMTNKMGSVLPVPTTQPLNHGESCCQESPSNHSDRKLH